MNQNQQLIPIEQDYLRNARQVFNNLDVRQSTITDYQYRIGLFADFVIKQGFHQNTFLEFKRYLASRNDYSVSTKNKYLITAKVFLRELHRNNRIPNLTENIRTFNQGKRHKLEGVNDNEMQMVASWLLQLPQSPKNTRLKAIIALLALQGLREIEVTRLEVKDLDLVNKTILVLGKGSDNKELVYLQSETVQALREHLKLSNIASGPVFISTSNNSKKHRLSTRALRKIATELLHSLGIQKTPHGFRHFFTTTLVRSYKGDLLEVARYTRHKSLEMLQVYNDTLKHKTDLPRFYATFENVTLYAKAQKNDII